MLSHIYLLQHARLARGGSDRNGSRCTDAACFILSNWFNEKVERNTIPQVAMMMLASAREGTRQSFLCQRHAGVQDTHVLHDILLSAREGFVYQLKTPGAWVHIPDQPLEQICLEVEMPLFV